MYRIANLNIEILHIRRNQFLERLVPFRITSGTPDVTYEVKYGEKFPLSDKDTIIYQSKVLAVAVSSSQSIKYIHMAEGVAYALVERHSSSDYTIFLQNDIFDYKLHPYVLPDLLHLEQVLMEKGMVVLHSSYIESEGGAILFTAPSGGGKSTQAELWRKYKSARIINGDKSIIGYENGKWRAYGIPFSGSSEYCLNESYPIRAIVVLEKGEENILHRRDIQEFSKVFSQMPLNVWDKKFCAKAMNLAADICSQIPVYHYICNREQDAVDTLYQKIKEQDG